MNGNRVRVIAASRDLRHSAGVMKVARGHYLALCDCGWKCVRKQSSWCAAACQQHVRWCEAKAAHEKAQRIAGRWGESLEDRQL